MRGRGTASIVASPVLVGAVTVLIVVVGVFLAYNANNGLPFVPTYEINAELPSGQKLVRGNEIRLGGFRVGTVTDLKPGMKDGKAIAVLQMELEKTVDPLPKDTAIGGGRRSALGLKYRDILAGKSTRALKPGDRGPLSQSKPQGIEYEDVFSPFDKPT